MLSDLDEAMPYTIFIPTNPSFKYLGYDKIVSDPQALRSKWVLPSSVMRMKLRINLIFSFRFYKLPHCEWDILQCGIGPWSIPIDELLEGNPCLCLL